MEKYNRSENMDYINKGLEDWIDDVENEKADSTKQKELDEEKRITRNIPTIEKVPVDKESALKFLSKEKAKLANIKYEGFFDDKDVRENYKNRMKEIVEAVDKNKIEEIIFLDKGARLFGYFFSKTWEVIKTEIPKPNINFINIGYEKDKSNPLVNENYEFFFDKNKFHETTKDIKTQILKTFGNKFDKKKILIFDEHCQRGNTLLYSSKLFEKIYPKSEIYSEWFDWGESSSEFAAKDLDTLTSGNNCYINTEKLREYPSGIVEASNKQSIQAKPWTKEQKENTQKEIYLKNMTNIRKQLYKMALEMLPREK